MNNLVPAEQLVGSSYVGYAQWMTQCRALERHMLPPERHMVPTADGGVTGF